MVLNPLLHRRNALLLISALLSMMVLQTAAIDFYFEFPFTPILWDALVNWLALGGWIFLITNTLSFYHPRSGKLVLILGLPLLLGYFSIKASTLFLSWIITDGAYLQFMDGTQFYRFTVFTLLFAGTVIINWIWYQLADKEERLLRREETIRMTKDAELLKLRQQLQPHFLFNSLNSINSLIGSRPQDARSMVQQLSDFLRGTVKREDQKLVSLKEELDYLKLYLNIEQVRFGHRLKVEIDCPEEALVKQVPTLILQPLLENAIKFGLYGTVGEIHIRLQCVLLNQQLQISLENPFDKDIQAPSGTGFGLQSVYRRLYLLYGRKDLLHNEEDGHLFRVHLKIP